MPVCWITGCKFIPGRMHNGHEIKLHSFPNSMQRIKEWLLQLGQHFNDIDNIANQILESKQKKSNKFRFCSLHFSDDSFIVNACGRTLRPNALPTIFDSASHSSEKIHEELSLRKTFKRKRKEQTSDVPKLFHTAPSKNQGKKTSNEPSVPDTAPSQNLSPLIPPEAIKSEVDYDFPSYTSSTESSVESSDIITTIIKTESYQDAETQTDFTFENSTIHLTGQNLTIGNSAATSCTPPYLTLQNPIVVLNCFLNAPSNPS
ncbi:uncharacterized protein LOC130284486 [Hyla sarda]|uniref:uncharacterized protein LOC130284486 n=1 Tax=Hyla sarda TaxID=327740 RepID=UPI0024C45E0A|nr:uncharacterized protein LOC130284486 [Hyla sarda]